MVLTSRVIELGIRVHRRLGPGLLEAIYEECLCWELRHGGIEHVRLVALAVTYEDMRLAGAYRADIIVEKSVLLEIKAIARILPVHEAQTLTYVRLSGRTTDELQQHDAERRPATRGTLTLRAKRSKNLL